MIELLESAITSPWVYLALFAIAVLDGFFPVVPSETMVITAGVFAASGEPNLAAVSIVAVPVASAHAGHRRAVPATAATHASPTAVNPTPGHDSTTTASAAHSAASRFPDM
jgi:hypothetical protein